MRIIFCILLAILLLTGCTIAQEPTINFTEGAGSPIVKVDNPEAVDVTYQELSKFLLRENIYFWGEKKCGDYAEFLHNAAEASGIKTAMVFAPVGEGYHAFNLFNTIDQGRVYVDMTGGIPTEAKRLGDGSYEIVRVVSEPIRQIRTQTLPNEDLFLIFW